MLKKSLFGMPTLIVGVMLVFSPMVIGLMGTGTIYPMM